MLIIHFSRSVLVAIQAAKHLEVVDVCMAVLTGIPRLSMFSGMDGEVGEVMVEVCFRPGCGAVARHTGGRIPVGPVLILIVLRVTGEAVILIARMEDEVEARQHVAALAKQRLVRTDELVAV